MFDNILCTFMFYWWQHTHYKTCETDHKSNVPPYTYIIAYCIEVNDKKNNKYAQNGTLANENKELGNGIRDWGEQNSEK